MQYEGVSFWSESGLTSSLAQVADVTEVQWLAMLPDLRVLWLSDNPCAETPSYRQKICSPLDAIQCIIFGMTTVST